MMKKAIFLLGILSLVFSACEYDNYEPPKSELTGEIVYEGEPLGLRQNINVLKLYEPGWENYNPISLHVKQDASFSSLLFNGDYKLVLINNNGPWVNQLDTIDVSVKGSENLTVPVTPFFMIRNPKVELVGSKLKAEFNLEHIVENKNLQFVSLYIGETMLVDNRIKLREQRQPAGGIDNIEEPISLEMDVSNIDKDFVFARIGVKTKGSSELIFSEVQKIDL